MRKALLTSLLFASASLTTLTAHADPVDLFTLDAAYNNTITFSLPVPPITEGGAVDADDFRTEFLLININGTNAGGQLDLFTPADGGGLLVTYIYHGGRAEFYAQGDQLFSGTTADPTILPGTYDLTDLTGAPETLTITRQPPASTPEPGTLILLATGALACLPRSRRLPRI